MIGRCGGEGEFGRWGGGGVEGSLYLGFGGDNGGGEYLGGDGVFSFKGGEGDSFFLCEDE